MDYIIPLFDLNFDQAEEDAIVSTLRSKWISTGPKTAEFENNFASLLNTKHAIALSNCTAALHLAMKLLNINDGDKVKKGTLLSEWDPYTTPFISEISGKIKFKDLEVGVTLKEQVDEVTGIFKKVVIESKILDNHPTLIIKPGKGADIKYALPIGAIVEANENDHVDAGDIIAKIPRATAKTKDITGGLPRVAELFEARIPKDPAVVSEIDGMVNWVAFFSITC